VACSQPGTTSRHRFRFAFDGSTLFVLLLWRELSRVGHADAGPDAVEVPVIAAN
jgi:hypothetical protein